MNTSFTNNFTLSWDLHCNQGRSYDHWPKLTPDVWCRDVREVTTIDQINIDGDKKKISDHFNRHFQPVFSVTMFIITHILHRICLELTPFLMKVLFSRLLNSNTTFGCGPDEISNAFLRRYAECLNPFLGLIFRMSFTSSELPNDWLMERVVPVFKKDACFSLSNYRPISTTCTLCKLIEHIVSTYIPNLKRNIITHAQQFPKRPIYCDTTGHNRAWARVSVDKAGQTEVIFLYFCKAFDKGPRGRLSFKL